MCAGAGLSGITVRCTHAHTRAPRCAARRAPAHTLHTHCAALLPACCTPHATAHLSSHRTLRAAHRSLLHWQHAAGMPRVPRMATPLSSCLEGNRGAPPRAARISPLCAALFLRIIPAYGIKRAAPTGTIASLKLAHRRTLRRASLRLAKTHDKT